MAITKPPVLPAWAESGDKVTPSNAEIQVGWPLSSIPPSRQRFNWLLNFLANGIRYFSRRGLPDYDAAETYMTGDRIIGDDGKTYRSLIDNNTAQTPSASPTKWEEWAPSLSRLGYFLQAQTFTAFTTAGAAPNFTLTPSPAIAAYSAGTRLRVKFHAAGTGADVLNVSTLGNKSLKQYDSSGAKVAAVIAANQLADIEYDGVDLVILDPLPTSPKGKNAIINGNFDIWQRNTSFAITTTGTNYTADRWLANIGTTGNNSTISRQAFTLGQGVVPNEPTYWLRYAVTAFVSGVPSLEQRIEGVRTLAGKQVTMSFWAKADAARTVSVSLNQVFGTGGSPSAGVNTALGSFNLTTAWQQFSATVTLPSISGKTLGTNGDDYLQMLFVLPGAVSTIDIAQVQVEASSSATAFDLLPTQQVLALCQRYYEKSYDPATFPGAVAAAGCMSLTLGTGTVERILMQYKVPKRAIPTVVTYSPQTGAVSKLQANGADIACGLNNNSTTSVQAVNSGALYRDFSVHFTADAEL